MGDAMHGVERFERAPLDAASLEIESIELDAPLDCYVFDPDTLSSDSRLDSHVGVERGASTPSRANPATEVGDSHALADEIHGVGEANDALEGEVAAEPSRTSDEAPEPEHAAISSDPLGGRAGQGSGAAQGRAHDVDQIEFWSDVVELHRVIATDPGLRGVLTRFGSPLHTAIVCVAVGASHAATHGSPPGRAEGLQVGVVTSPGDFRDATGVRELLDELQDAGAAALLVAYQQRGSALRAAEGNRG